MMSGFEASPSPHITTYPHVQRRWCRTYSTWVVKFKVSSTAPSPGTCGDLHLRLVTLLLRGVENRIGGVPFFVWTIFDPTESGGCIFSRIFLWIVVWFSHWQNFPAGQEGSRLHGSRLQRGPVGVWVYSGVIKRALYLSMGDGRRRFQWWSQQTLNMWVFTGPLKQQRLFNLPLRNFISSSKFYFLLVKKMPTNAVAGEIPAFCLLESSSFDWWKLHV